MTCECKGCIEMTRFFKIVKQLPDEDRKWMEELYETIDGERLDANVNQCIIEGTWPTADQIIAHERSKVIVFEHKKEQ